MRRIGPDAWAGLAMLAGSVVVGAPVLFGAGETRVPRLLWALLFAALLMALVTAAVLEDAGTVAAWAAYATAVVLSWAVVLTASDAGWLPILLVFVAAVSGYLVPVWAGAAVVALNSVVIAVSMPGPWAGVAVGTSLYLLIQVSTLLASIAMKRERRLRRELAAAHLDLRAASVVLADSARARERLRIARELHDLIGHQLTVLTLELEVARHQEGGAAREHVERADRVARALLGDVRDTVGRLRTGAPHLRESLTAVVRDIPGLDISVRVGDDVPADEDLAATLVRVVQEIVTNTIRHAEATSLLITVDRAPDGAVRLTSVDDGRGAPALTPGNGLRGLTERIAALGGDVRLDGGDGFRVTARVPAR